MPASQTLFPALCKLPPFDCKFRSNEAKSEALAACTATSYPPDAPNEATYKNTSLPPILACATESLFNAAGLVTENPILTLPFKSRVPEAESAASLLKNELACMPSTVSESNPEPEPSLTLVQTSCQLCAPPLLNHLKYKFCDEPIANCVP